MDINSYSFSHKQINPRILELLVTHIESNVTFGLRINAQGNPAPNQIFDIFQKHYKDFWIESPAIKDEPKEEIKDLTKDGSSIIVGKDEKLESQSVA